MAGPPRRQGGMGRLPQKAGMALFGGLMALAVAVNVAALGNAAVRAVRRFTLSRELKDVPMYKLKNGRVLVHLSPLGASIQRLFTEDRSGRMADIVLGFGSLVPYKDGTSPYMGVVVGRVANRVAKSRFTLDGKTHELFPNNGKNSLHGGQEGFDKKLWKVENVTPEPGDQAVRFTYVSKDGEEGYPGNLKVSVTYTLKPDGELLCEMSATCDKPTPVNLAQHSYFNLRGHDFNNILHHKIQILSDKITPVDGSLIPTGKFDEVTGTSFDFREEKVIGHQIEGIPGGYDHNYVLRSVGEARGGTHLAARLYEPISGRAMDVSTNQPGLQFYTGNFIDRLRGKGGAVYGPHAGLCLETQGFPDSVNQPRFPSQTLRPGNKYRHIVSYKFYTREE